MSAGPGRPWAVVQHVDFEGPGLIAEEAARRGVELRTVRTDLGRPLPGTGSIGGLVVMGGPMGVADGEAHPHLRAEVELIAGAVAAGLPVLGVCLGAQLMAAALGAEVRPGDGEEVGAGEVLVVADDPVLGPAGTRLPVFHWHGDTFEVPPGAELIASSERYPHQAFRHGERAYALQFHVEIGRDAADAMSPHLPAGVVLGEVERLEIERAGRPVIARFFDLAL